MATWGGIHNLLGFPALFIYFLFFSRERHLNGKVWKVLASALTHKKESFSKCWLRQAQWRKRGRDREKKRKRVEKGRDGDKERKRRSVRKQVSWDKGEETLKTRKQREKIWEQERLLFFESMNEWMIHLKMEEALIIHQPLYQHLIFNSTLTRACLLFIHPMQDSAVQERNLLPNSCLSLLLQTLGILHTYSAQQIMLTLSARVCSLFWRCSP